MNGDLYKVARNARSLSFAAMIADEPASLCSAARPQEYADDTLIYSRLFSI
jgi:hypothetical protein